MFSKVVRSLCRDRRGLTVVAGAIAVLTGVEHLLSTRPRKRIPIVPAPIIPEPAPPIERPRLKISQTRSELGYVYWVLRQYGAQASYALFDTWQEAMDEAARRMNAVPLASAGYVLVPA